MDLDYESMIGSVFIVERSERSENLFSFLSE